jgi:PTS system ascorbate-specific IIA component
MNNGIFIIAHAPLASALRQCVLHVFPDAAASIAVFDVMANIPSDETVVAARMTMKMLNKPQVLVFTDLFGATPCNVAQKLVDGISSRLIAGVNLPMLLRAVTYRNESLDALVTRAVAGGTQGVMQVAVTAPQNQTLRPHDKNNYDHQQ